MQMPKTAHRRAFLLHGKRAWILDADVDAIRSCSAKSIEESSGTKQGAENRRKMKLFIRSHEFFIG